MLTISGCGALSIARVDNLNQVLAISFGGGIGIGGILILPSVISTIICPDVSFSSGDLDGERLQLKPTKLLLRTSLPQSQP